MIWWSLVIPLIALGVLFFFFNHKLHLNEIIALVLVPACVITFFYFATKNSHMSDTQQLSELIVKARYYESWETWVVQECSRQVVVGEDCTTGSDGKQTCVTKYRTEYYDCFYCDYNSEYYVAVTISNKEISISRAQYYALLKKWKTKGNFIELNRSIDYSGSCGKDGDMYEGNWNLDLFTAESHTWQESYNNRTQAALSAFNYPKITPIEAKKLGLYEYPAKYYNGYTEPNILGFENIYQSKQLKDSIFTLYQYLNGFIGPKYKAHVYILLFKDQDINIAFKQEAYWANGNQNEIVIYCCKFYLGYVLRTSDIIRQVEKK